MTSTARWSLRRTINVSVAAVALFSIAAILVGGWSLTRLAEARELVVDRIDPAQLHATRLEAALVNQETGVRGFALGAREDLLRSFVGGVEEQSDAARQLEPLLTDLPDAQISLSQVLARAESWRTVYADPTIAAVDAADGPASPEPVQGQELFDGVRAAIDRLQHDLGEAKVSATATLNRTSTTLNVVCVAIAVGFVLVVITLAITLRRAALRPVSQLAEEVRWVASGDFSHVVAVRGPQEVSELGDDVNRMREQILDELAALRTAHAELDTRTQDLVRSNQELEQFAYVASHDLQEPLRKVASFCQLLQRRYGGQLDERADQYIAFAVDGAKRMQELINDLLAFSRVGRISRELVTVSCDTIFEQAKANLATVIEQSGASVTAEPLPSVRAEVPLLTAVFQNLIGNAIKFHGDAPPVVAVTVRRDGDFWEFSVTDNGIGIAPEYADRIFVIFQRLHNKADYPGTGIGLAMCRKIIEHHGGTIWLDTGVESGSRFRFTLPALRESETPTEEEDSE
ncbi:histidine kinase [Actinophytocola xinjiangensis]|uniref:histidine kinase n=1 Tax=Actinophytocola xinjiangensis TaxID=485602 RepID=A0A7Z1AYT7_9PSEU|nr:sensor histidine kinase [Actinophytocola xinjiangensis]OLF10238.1 histidine kinase [Actinophytocola xinjiangensis]